MAQIFWHCIYIDNISRIVLFATDGSDDFVSVQANAIKSWRKLLFVEQLGQLC